MAEGIGERFGYVVSCARPVGFLIAGGQRKGDEVALFGFFVGNCLRESSIETFYWERRSMKLQNLVGELVFIIGVMRGVFVNMTKQSL